jgi:hypothetical protein
MCAVSLSGCVIPPTLEEHPPAPNQSPVIVRDDRLRPKAGHVTLGECRDLVLQLPVEDANTQDTLTLRVFLDFSPVFTTQATLPTGDVVRNLLVPLSSPCALLQGRLSGVLEAVVSDRGFAGDGRETPPGAGTDTVVWDLTCEQCPDGGP